MLLFKRNLKRILIACGVCLLLVFVFYKENKKYYDDGDMPVDIHKARRDIKQAKRIWGEFEHVQERKLTGYKDDTKDKSKNTSAKQTLKVNMHEQKNAQKQDGSSVGQMNIKQTDFIDKKAVIDNDANDNLKSKINDKIVGTFVDYSKSRASDKTGKATDKSNSKVTDKSIIDDNSGSETKENDFSKSKKTLLEMTEKDNSKIKRLVNNILNEKNSNGINFESNQDIIKKVMPDIPQELINNNKRKNIPFNNETSKKTGKAKNNYKEKNESSKRQREVFDTNIRNLNEKITYKNIKGDKNQNNIISNQGLLERHLDDIGNRFGEDFRENFRKNFRGVASDIASISNFAKNISRSSFVKMHVEKLKENTKRNKGTSKNTFGDRNRSPFDKKLKEIDVEDLKPVHPKQLVHFDLKGAPPRIPYFKQVMDYAKEFGADGFLFEYEDMFPWHGELSVVKSKYAYTVDELNILLDYAEHLHMAVIPLVQTFGHMEFVLKHKKFAHLRRNNGDERSVCPMNNQSVPFVKQMIDQILDFHPNIKWIHLGADEVFDLGKCHECPESGIPKDELYEKHMIPILKYVQTKLNNNKEQINSIIWDDMVNNWSVPQLKKLSSLTTLMVWNYVGELERFFPTTMWSRYSQAFTHIWGASAFKGADRPWTNWVKPDRRVANHQGWLRRITHLEHHGLHVDGIVLTAWSRFNHNEHLCELLPVGIPMMALALALGKTNKTLEEVNKDVSVRLGFKTPIVLKAEDVTQYTPQNATFVGSDLFYLMAKLDKVLYHCRIIKEDITKIHITFTSYKTELDKFSYCKIELKTIKSEIKTSLNKYFFPDIAEEFTTDKIDNTLFLLVELEKGIASFLATSYDITQYIQKDKYKKYVRNKKMLEKVIVRQPSLPRRQPSPPRRQPSPPGRQPSPPGRQPSPPGRQPSPPGKQPSPPRKQPSPPRRQPTPPKRKIIERL